ncbi:hypothetical protein O3M35_006732 [Rhynocoris fuscipes]|uniref:Uncharacterized protein n=1 Tax=Rhynocoris fuscipes TaxID=488301 RepID=A0AAW1DH81_9HEMI
MPQRVPSGGLSPPSGADYSAVLAAESFDLSLLPPSPTIHVNDNNSEKSEDHKLLREVLKDTSFQRKYNLIPVSVGELGTGFRTEMEEVSMDLAQEEIEPMLSLAMEQLKTEVHSTCSVLGISRGESILSSILICLFILHYSSGNYIPFQDLFVINFSHTFETTFYYCSYRVYQNYLSKSLQINFK